MKNQRLTSAQSIHFHLMYFLLFCDWFLQLDSHLGLSNPHLRVSHQEAHNLSLNTCDNQKPPTLDAVYPIVGYLLVYALKY